MIHGNERVIRRKGGKPGANMYGIYIFFVAFTTASPINLIALYRSCRDVDYKH